MNELGTKHEEIRGIRLKLGSKVNQCLVDLEYSSYMLIYVDKYIYIYMLRWIYTYIYIYMLPP